MSKNTDSKHDEASLDTKFSEWLMDKSAGTARRNRSDLKQDHVWEQRAQITEKIEHYADITPDEPVPNWDRSASFETEIKPWWQWQGLPAMSFVFSLFAVSLVFLNVEVVIKEQGVSVSFAGNNQADITQNVETLLDQKLQNFAKEQQIVLANYAADITGKQQESNIQLASYIMGVSRKERKEDMNDFINYINDQRQDDQRQQQLTFKRFAETILYQSASVPSANDNVTTANWITEE
ncbi:hypothetical protein Q4489_10665 [Thalassotalea sp. 1_MG-2023]|uniref:hypothetical protein n=1 Tax=Thalassotalea sp. 1_MG-2023 TaxID=3062680 RepID=UPI0026E32222|nr:hypothetical protein [Thalassotalea sp. 1_MG-2023]MDO6427480.1 hypothetical protein [Thalassotalea sp. 1_MG-2023]